MNLFEALSDARLEIERPFISGSQGRTEEEKANLYEARTSMLLLPLQGPYGGLMAKIARECGCSRHYVQLTLFPEDPAKLFGSSEKQKKIWDTMAELVRSNEMYEPMKLAFHKLEEEGQVTLKIKVNFFKFFIKRAADRGFRVSYTEQRNTSPRTYTIVRQTP